MREAIPPLPNTPSWRGAKLKKSTGTNKLLPFYPVLKHCQSMLLSRRESLSFIPI
jgi:hypothetical protein